jgi:hypothetical protein
VLLHRSDAERDDPRDLRVGVAKGDEPHQVALTQREAAFPSPALEVSRPHAHRPHQPGPGLTRGRQDDRGIGRGPPQGGDGTQPFVVAELGRHSTQRRLRPDSYHTPEGSSPATARRDDRSGVGGQVAPGEGSSLYGLRAPRDSGT